MAHADDELAYASISAIAPRLASSEVSPVELTQACLDRIAGLDGRVNAFITGLADLALEEARRAESEIRQGQYRGPLHGIPIALKDLYYTAGLRTTAGSKILADFALPPGQIFTPRWCPRGMGTCEGSVTPALLARRKRILRRSSAG